MGKATTVMANETIVAPVYLEGERVIVREAVQKDYVVMQYWRGFTDPLYPLWNIPRNAADYEIGGYTAPPRNIPLQYTIVRKSDNEVVGRLSIRDVRDHLSARLGIHLGADYIDQGYGTEAMRLFLDYFFHRLGFQEMVLDVAAVNPRAVHLYEKLGFRQVSAHFRDIPSGRDLSFLREPQYEPLRRHFRRSLGRMQVRFIDMSLRREEWEQIEHDLSRHSPT